MFIEKDGISREVDEKRLQEFVDKGYIVVDDKKKKPDKGTKPKKTPKSDEDGELKEE